MEWWGWVAWAVAVVSGAYGAWRAWATERKLTATEAAWVIEHVQKAEYRLRSRLPYTARGITLTFPEQMRMVKSLPFPTEIRPTESAKLLVSRLYGAWDDNVRVTWSTRFGRTKTALVPVPPEAERPASPSR